MFEPLNDGKMLKIMLFVTIATFVSHPSEKSFFG